MVSNSVCVCVVCVCVSGSSPCVCFVRPTCVVVVPVSLPHAVGARGHAPCATHAPDTHTHTHTHTRTHTHTHSHAQGSGNGYMETGNVSLGTERGPTRAAVHTDSSGAGWYLCVCVCVNMCCQIRSCLGFTCSRVSLCSNLMCACARACVCTWCVRVCTDNGKPGHRNMANQRYLCVCTCVWPHTAMLGLYLFASEPLFKLACFKTLFGLSG